MAHLLKLLLASLPLWLPAALKAQAVLGPPFGLRWGDSPEKLIDWISRHSLDTNIFLPGDQPAIRILKASPRKGFLPGTQASEVEARFIGGRLFEVTVHYEDPEAGPVQMETRFAKLRQQVTAEYGELTANKQGRTTDNQFSTRTRSFHREPVQGLFLLLVFTEVEDLLRKQRETRFSISYRNDNFRKEMERRIEGTAEPSKPLRPRPGP